MGSLYTDELLREVVDELRQIRALLLQPSSTIVSDLNGSTTRVVTGEGAAVSDGHVQHGEASPVPPAKRVAKRR